MRSILLPERFGFRLAPSAPNSVVWDSPEFPLPTVFKKFRRLHKKLMLILYIISIKIAMIKMHKKLLNIYKL